MMISYKYLAEPMVFDNKNINILVLENKAIFREAFLSLSSDEENNGFVFSENFEPFDFQKNVCFIQNALLFDFKNKRLQNKINYDMAQMINEVYFVEFEKLQSLLSQLVCKFSESFDFEFFSSSEITPQSVVKFLSFEPKFDTVDSPLDNLLFYIELFSKYLDIKCFVTFDLFVYYDLNELSELFKSLKLKNIFLLDIENKTPCCKTDDFVVSVVDKSLCSIIDN